MPSSSMVQEPNQPLSCLCPLMGYRHPSSGLFIPMEVRIDQLSMCTGPNGTCPSGMVLHIKGYALNGLINHRDHGNVDHISSLKLSNICITSLTNLLRAQKPYTNPLYKAKATKGQPIGLIPTRNGKFPQRIIQTMYSDVMWF